MKKQLLTFIFSLSFLCSFSQIANTPLPLELCDVNNPGDEQESFTLEDANAEILNGQTGVTLTYYETQIDADNGTDPIVSPYVNITNPQTLYVRVEDLNTGNYDTTTLTIRVLPLPSPSDQIPSLEVCDDDNDGFSVFDLTANDIFIFNGEIGVSVAYFETEFDAINEVNPIINPSNYINITPDSHTIYGRVETDATGCFTVVNFNLIVNPFPTFSIDDISICDGSSVEVSTGLDPSEHTFMWSTGESSPTITVTLEGTYWVVVTNFEGCLSETGFNVTFQGPSFNLPNPLYSCDFNGNGIGEFDLTQATPEIIGSQTDLEVTYYATQAEAEEGITSIVDTFSYVNITPFDQLLYFRVESLIDGCFSIGSLELIVSGVAPLNPLSSYVVCDIDQDGFTEFNLQSINELVLVGQGNLNLFVSYHLTESDAANGTNVLTNPYTNVTNPQMIYVVVTDTNGCGTAIESFNLVADQTCMPCQTITPSIDSTVPEMNGSGIVSIFAGETVEFNGSATFSEDDTNAIYSWNFGDGNAASGTNVSNTYTNPGSYTINFTVQGSNPIGCQETISIEVDVLNPIVSVNNANHSESFFSPEELIANVLVTEGCLPVNIFTSQVNGNPNDIETKNYGYFNRGAAVNFPFEEGIVLTTGVASQAGNVTNGILVSNDNGQSGDVDLETALSISNTNDAAFIKFNFVPTSNEISFRYLMASEEYDGSTECNFADSFAFLLREVGTTEYINLAVLPDGTPVSVTNINDSGLCNNNPDFFEGYNIGDTNYGGRTTVLTASATVIPNATYEIKLVIADQGDSIWDSAIFLEAGSFNLGDDGCNDIGFINVRAFNDANTSGDIDNDESNFINGSFTYEKNNDGVVNVVNSSTGSFTILSTDENDTYDITYVVNEDYADCYSQSVTAFDDISAVIGELTQVDFPIEDNLTCEDLGVYLINSFASPRPGFEHLNTLIIENLSGANIASGSVEFVLDDNLLINDTSLSNSNLSLTTTATGFTLDFTNLGAGETENVDITLFCPVTVALGEIVTNTATYITDSNDTISENNLSSLSEEVIGSYDPNDKMEAHGKDIVFDDFITSDEYLFYTIRFQNVGTAEAINVRIEDVLDVQLDETTFQMLRSSHDYVVTRTEENLEWTFENINLPAEQDDAEGSNGFVYFKIKPKAGYSIGDIIPNSASIYFDFNAPIITNTFTTTFVETLSVDTYGRNDFKIYPNPANDYVTIELNAINTSSKLEVYDIQGKVILVNNNINSESIQLNISEFNSGLYFIKVSNSGASEIQKLIID